MGQKVSPIGMRVGVIRDWESRWYADKADYGDLPVQRVSRLYVREDLEELKSLVPKVILEVSFHSIH